MHLQMVFTVTNHLRCFIQYARSQDVRSMLNANRGSLCRNNNHNRVFSSWRWIDTYVNNRQSRIPSWNKERRQSAVEKDYCNDKLGSSLKNFELTAWGSNDGSNSDARRFGSEQRSISAIVRSSSIVHYLLCLSSDLDWWSLHANTVCSARRKDFLPIHRSLRLAHRLSLPPKVSWNLSVQLLRAWRSTRW